LKFKFQGIDKTKSMTAANSHNFGIFNMIRRVGRSIFPGYRKGRTDGEFVRGLFKSLLLHFRPRTVPESTLRFSLTWGLGGMAAMLVMLQFGTGILLKFAYEPTATGAYSSVLHLKEAVPFGKLVRNMHHWSANFLIGIVFLHLLRTFFTGAFRVRRQFNWVIGLGLLGTVLAANFTGYLLPWDQLAYWAVTICTGMLGYIPWLGSELQQIFQDGSEIGPATLQLFYAVHTALIPVFFICLMAFHFWRIRKAGGLVTPQPEAETEMSKPVRVPAIPNLILREVVVAVCLVAFILTLSVFFNAPLGAPANPGLSPNPTKAPWYFAGVQELLLHFHPLFAVLIIPLLMLLGLLLLPYISYYETGIGVWFISPKGRRTAAIAAVVALVLTPIFIVLDEFVFDAGHWLSGVNPIISSGVAPTLVVLVVVTAFFLIVRFRMSGSTSESVQAVFTLATVAWIVMTITCVWMRGEEMRLMWP
jgi:quinol-cytochrome oxidoreductase complex cytochrome b subunit